MNMAYGTIALRPALASGFAFSLALGLARIPHAAIADPAAFAGAAFERHGGERDFDFEFGSWRAHIHRLRRPLTGSHAWVDYDGTSIVRRVWGGGANLGELNVHGPAGSITGLTLRLYDPATKQWAISWASARDGTLGAPMIGGFSKGIGEFYDHERFAGKPIVVRFIFHDVKAGSFSLDQSFSPDGGTTWAANWLARFTRTP